MASDFQIRHAASLLHRGGIIVYPTDTIYGLGCDPLNMAAVQRIADIKQRPPGKSLIVLAHHTEQLAGIVSPEQLNSHLANHDQAPTTWVLPADDHCPPWLRHRDGTVAVRLTDYPLVARLCKQFGRGIVSTSANLSGTKPLQRKLDLRRVFRPCVDTILHCNTAGTGKPSTIKHYSDQRILRHSS